MISRLFMLLALCLSAVSCNKTQQNPNATTNTTKVKTKFTETDLKKMDYKEFTLDQNVKSKIEPWLGYFTLATIIEDLKTPDFLFFEENDYAISDLLDEIRETLPKEFKTQAVLSRITIVESMLYKTKEASTIHAHNKSELLKAVKNLSEAFSNLNFQLNKKLEKDAQKIERPI